MLLTLALIAIFWFMAIELSRAAAPQAPTQINYYVSTAGNDSNSGLSVGTAWRTIQHAVDSFDTSNLATINVATGIYGEAVTITKSGVGGIQPSNNVLTCVSGVAYTTSLTVSAAGWTVSSCIIAAAGPTATATATFTPAPTNTPVPTQTPTVTQTPTPTPSPASCTINVLGTVISVDHLGTLRCATPTATP